MTVSQDSKPENTPSFRKILDLMENRLRKPAEEAAKTHLDFEKSLHSAVGELERDLITSDLARLDVEAPGIVFKGERYVRRRDKTPGTYFTIAGKVTVDRSTYRKRGGDGGETIVPMELRVGFVGGSWTQLAAQVASAFSAAVPTEEATKLLAQAGSLNVSPSHLDQLPKVFNEMWEKDREHLEEQLRELRPTEETGVVATILISLDGVMVPMKDAPRVPGLGKEDTGPKGHQEAGCGTLSFFDKDGNRITTVAFGRMPEAGKVALAARLEAELSWAVKTYPNAHVEAVADGAKENWRIIADLERNVGVKINKVLDFYHAMEHVAEALRRYRGRDKERTRREIEKYRKILRDEPGGHQTVVQALEYRSRKSAGAAKKDIDKELRYVRRHADRMRYHVLQKSKRPIGSGVQEAACKTLVVHRMKQSGMSWRHTGGQGVLTLRGLFRSDQLEESWNLLRPALSRPFQVDEDTSRKRYAVPA